MKILLTGTPGSGKTTLTKFAQSKNDKRFYDADEIEGLCEWREFKTGKVLGLVSSFIETGEDEWYEKYGWYWRPDVLKKFLDNHKNAVVCGSAENATDLYALFDDVAILIKIEADLLSNLSSQDRNNPFGKTTGQRKNFMNWQNHLLNHIPSPEPFCIHGNNTSHAYNRITENYFSK